MRLRFWIHTPNRFPEKRQAADDNQLGFRSAQSDVHPAMIAQEPEGTTSRHGIIAYERENDDISFTPLEGINRSDERSVAADRSKIIQVLKGTSPLSSDGLMQLVRSEERR